MKSSPRTPLRRLAGLLVAAASVMLGGCAGTQSWVANPPLMPSLKAALQEPAEAPARAAAPAPAAAATPATPTPAAAAVKEDALLPLTAGRAERRFSVVLNNATPEVLFMALLAETPLSVAVDPSVKGPLSISLKDVTLREALDLLRELHGLEYKVIGRHILVSAAQLQTRIFTVDYPSFNRAGRSELRVLSGSITGNAALSAPGGGQANPYNSAGATGGGSTATNASQESSRVSTAQRNDLWGEIETSVKLIIGDKEGRSVVVSPQTGNIVVRALPREIRAINDYLEATRLSVQRQVMLEAKVVEVQLRDSERTGINWAAFKAGQSTRGAAGMVAPGATLSNSTTIGDGLITFNPAGVVESAATAAGSLLGLAFQTRNFAAVLDFLGTQGNTQVLSSPRIATMNNQKAVLKVGTDDFFVTSISSTTTAVGNTTATTPNIGVQPFFSGISLDVTPNIDAGGFITLHVHPSVSSVSERTKIINLGTQGSYSLPLASSEINESDAVVRAHDGHIIAIGGLMRQSSMNSDSGIPGTEGSGIFRKLLGGQTSRLSEKRELVILLKPTIVDPASEESDSRRDALQRLLDWTETQPLVKPMKLEVPRAASGVKGTPQGEDAAKAGPAVSSAATPAVTPAGTPSAAATPVPPQPTGAVAMPIRLSFADLGRRSATDAEGRAVAQNPAQPITALQTPAAQTPSATALDWAALGKVVARAPVAPAALAVPSAPLAPVAPVAVAVPAATGSVAAASTAAAPAKAVPAPAVLAVRQSSAVPLPPAPKPQQPAPSPVQPLPAAVPGWVNTRDATQEEPAWFKRVVARRSGPPAGPADAQVRSSLRAALPPQRASPWI